MKASKFVILSMIIAAVCMSIYCDPGQNNSADEGGAETDLVEYPKAIVNVNIADLRKSPEKHAERVSQAFFNEVVEVIDTTKGYSRIRQWDGYLGWTRTYNLDSYSEFSGDGPYIVDVYLAAACVNPENNSQRKTMFPYGCNLYGEAEGSCLRIETSRYKTVYVELTDLRYEPKDKPASFPDSAGIAREAEKFLGAPYLWGGKSFYGIDCSGLTQAVMKRFGIDLLRDSKDQIGQGTEIARDDIRAGDLLFFPHHVGLAVSRDLMIHSTGRNGGVAYNSLNPRDPDYNEYFDKNFITARRPGK